MSKKIYTVQVKADIEKALANVNNLKRQVDSLTSKEHSVKFKTELKNLTQTINKVDKLLDALGNGKSDFSQFNALGSQLEQIASNANLIGDAFKGLDTSKIQSLTNSISDMRKNMSELAQDIRTIANYSGAIDDANSGDNKRSGQKKKNSGKPSPKSKNNNDDTSVKLSYSKIQETAKRVRDSLREKLDDTYSINVDDSGIVKITKRLSETGDTVVQTFANAEDAIANFMSDAVDGVEKTSVKLAESAKKIKEGLSPAQQEAKNYKEATSALEAFYKIKEKIAKGDESEVTKQNYANAESDLRKAENKLTTQQKTRFQNLKTARSTDFNTFVSAYKADRTKKAKDNKASQEFKKALSDAEASYAKIVDLQNRIDGAQNESLKSSLKTELGKEQQSYEKLIETVRSYGDAVDDVNAKISKMETDVTESVTNKALSNRESELKKYNNLIDNQKNSLTNNKLTQSLNGTEYKYQVEQIIQAADQAALELRREMSDGLTGDELSTAFNKYKAQIEELKSQLSSIGKFSESLSLGDFDAKLASMKSGTSSYEGITIGNVSENVEKAKAAAKEYEEALMNIKNATNEVGKINLKPEEFVADITKMTEASKKYQNALTEIRSETTKSISSDEAKTLSNNILQFIQDNTRLSDEMKASLRELAEEAMNAQTQMDKLNINKTFESYKSDAKLKGLTGKTTFGELKSMAERVMTATGAYNMFQMVVQDIPQQIYQAVTEVDTAMTNLYKVTDESESRYEEFLKNAGSSAKELGRDISSYIEQTATWAKLGYDLDASKELSKISSIYANVGEVDDDTAVSDIVTAMKAFNIEASDAITIVDQLNALGEIIAHAYSNVCLASSYIG